MKKINVKGSLTKVVGTAGGAVAAGALNKVPFVQKQSPLIRGIIKIGLGAFVLPMIAKGKKNELIENAGNGMIAAGSIEVVNATVFKSNPIALSGTLPTLGEVGNMYPVGTPNSDTDMYGLASY